VDATWDSPLSNAGFPVNDHWDGYSETRCAVKPLKSPVQKVGCNSVTSEKCRANDEAVLCPVNGEKDHWEAEDRARYYREKVDDRTPEERKQIVKFYHDFDAWLIEIRKKEYQF
jgi:adenylate kinase family enzyme